MKKNIVYSLVFITVIISACKKKDVEAPKNKEVKATVVLSSGSIMTINATGSKALIGCTIGGTYVVGTNSLNASVRTYPNAGGLMCVTSPGTYSFRCEYWPDVSSSSAPVYGSLGITPGSITFTVINGHYMEGYFNAVCRCISLGCVYGVDSVIVTGTFKGDY